MTLGRRVVVIGSGPAGAMAARELVRCGVPVTMLESGTTEPSGLLVRAAGRNLYRRRTSPLPPQEEFVSIGNPDTAWYTSLEPGGLSNQWTGAVPRFAPDDFREGERLHERYRWPLDYDELAPFYTDAEKVLAVTAGPGDVPALPAGSAIHRRTLPSDWRAIARVARAHGQGLTILPLADGRNWLVTRQQTAFNSFTNIVQRLRTSPDFELRTGAHALRLEWSGSRRRVDSVVYFDRTARVEKRIDADAVVVACGAFRSTKLLFDSACADFPEGIGNGDGLLGLFVHDHVREWWSFETDRPLRRLSPPGYLTRRPYDVSPPLIATSWTLGLATSRDRVLSLVPSRANAVGVQLFGTMRPDEHRFVRPCSTAKDEFGFPQLELALHFEPDEVANVIDSRAHLLGLLSEGGYRAAINPIDPQLVPGYAVHYGGGARMHRSRAFGVLNEWNRPFDVPNVVVTDASCFTTNTEKNPTLTLMALSTRAARRLAADLKVG
jgi:choline dehydrogenase-like flavoprotein